ncbi:hypothetical protein AXW78_30030 (plasmid) [Bacillus thuringiensis]|nr:hypothetical protein AXW78_30030 [Bacillus thuringiensis]PNK26886.1 hypothetical protein CBR55_31690 [Bacillus thuringiensis]
MQNRDLFEYNKLNKLAEDSLQWINRHIDFFCPIQNQQLTQQGIKLLTELSLVYSYIKKCNITNLQNNIDLIFSFICIQFENPLYAQMPRKNPIDSYPCLVSYLMLRATEYQNPYYEETLEFLKCNGYLYACEEYPFRILERDLVFWRSKYLTQEPDWYSVYQSSILAKEVNPIYLNDVHVYYITHILFHLTNFGNRPLLLPNKEIRRIVKLLESLLLHYVRIGNWDLVGELLINLISLDQTDSIIYLECSKIFQNVWKEDGSVPKNKKIAQLSHAYNNQELFNHHYHSTIVGIMYCITALTRVGGEKSVHRENFVSD